MKTISQHWNKNKCRSEN